MRKFVTGGSGTIGSRLVSLGFEPLDVRDIQQLVRRVTDSSKPFVLVHCAGIVGPDLVDSNPDLAWSVNVRQTSALANALATLPNLFRFVNVSSSHVYASSENPVSESAEVSPRSLYALQKLEAERLVYEAFADRSGDFLIARVFSILDLVKVAKFSLGGSLANIVQGQRETEIRFADDVRDFLAPLQVAECLYSLALKQTVDPLLNVASGQGLTVRDASALALAAYGAQPKPHNFISGKSTFPYQVADVSLLARHYGRSPTLAFQEVDLFS